MRKMIDLGAKHKAQRLANRLDPAVIASQVEISYYKKLAYKSAWYQYHGKDIDVYFWEQSKVILLCKCGARKELEAK